MKNITQNKKARHDYTILETYEAGIALTGTEVKSCRANAMSLAEAYAQVKDGQLLLLSANISPYEMGNRFNHKPMRPRVLLMHKKEIGKLKKSIEAKGLTLVPLEAYFNDRGKVKIRLGLCRGKNVHDKRDSMKAKDAKKEMSRALRR